MIWLKQHNLVFVKIPKNASESFSYYFQKNASSEDVFTLDNGFYQNIDTPHREHSHMDASYILKHELATTDNRFIGVIRNPYERLLSLYFYRVKQKRYDNGVSIKDFRNRAREGVILDHEWHMQHQSSFLNGVDGEYLCYDNLSTHAKILSRQYGFKSDMLPKINKSVSITDTKNLVDIFYDDVTIKSVYKYWERDIELYDRIRSEEARLEYSD